MNAGVGMRHDEAAVAPEKPGRALQVVQVSTSDAGGGAERIAADLHLASLARGLESTLAVGHRFGTVKRTALIPNDARRNAWARAWLRLVPDSGALFGRQGATQRTYRRVVKSVAEPARAWRRLQGYEDFDYPGTPAIPTLGGAPADIVHLHNLHGGYFDLRCLPEISVATPCVLTAHDTWLASGHCAYALDCTRLARRVWRLSIPVDSASHPARPYGRESALQARHLSAKPRAPCGSVTLGSQRA